MYDKCPHIHAHTHTHTRSMCAIDPLVFNEMGVLRYLQGDYAEAAVAFEKVTHETPVSLSTTALSCDKMRALTHAQIILKDVSVYLSLCLSVSLSLSLSLSVSLSPSLAPFFANFKS